MSASTSHLIETELSTEALHDVLVRTLASFADPATIAGIRQSLPGPYRRDEGAIQRELDSLIQQGRVHRFQPYRGKSDRFWHRSLRDYAVALLTSQTVSGYWTKSELVRQFKARLKGLSDKEIGETIQQLVRSGDMHAGKFLGSQSMRFSARPIDAKALLENAIEQIARRCSIPVESLHSMILGDDASSTIRTSVANERVANERVSSERVAGEREILLEAISELQSSTGSNILSIAELRRFLAFKLDRDSFNRSMRELEREGRIDLTIHPDPGALTESGRSDRAIEPDGRVYDMLIVRR